MEVLRRPAVEAALVRQQVVELLERHFEARHGCWLTCREPLGGFPPHPPRAALSHGRRGGRGARRERGRAAPGGGAGGGREWGQNEVSN